MAVVQRRVAAYRVPFFARLAALDGVDLTVFASTIDGDPTALNFKTVLSRDWGNRLSGRVVFQPWAVYRILRDQFDVVICDGSVRTLTSLLLANVRRNGRPRVVWWTSMWDPRTGTVLAPAGAKGFVLRRTLRRVDACLAYSDQAASALRSTASSTVPVFTAYNSLDADGLWAAEERWRASRSDLDVFRRTWGLEGRSVVLFVGRLIEDKDLGSLVETFGILRESQPDRHPILGIVGEGPERAAVEQHVRNRGLDAHVVMAGEIRDLYEVCPWFLSARVFVLPRAGGLALFQAMAHGVPCVATAGDGTERDLIIEDDTGRLVPAGDVGALADAAARIIGAREAEWDDMSKACRQRIKQEINMDKMVGAFESAIRHVANAHQLTRRRSHQAISVPSVQSAKDPPTERS